MQPTHDNEEKLETIGERDHTDTAEYRIFGPPGTGKTTNLSRQIRRAVERFGPDSVLVTSFTRAAAAELAGRDLPINTHRIGTLHSHCWRALDGPAIAETQVEGWNRTNPSLRITPLKKQQCLDGDSGADDSSDRASDGDRWLQELNRVRGMMLPEAAWPAAVRSFARRWTDYKQSLGLLDFCDLIETALQEIPFAPGQPSVIFADEAQDLNRMQLSLVRKWGERARYFILAADDDQCQPPGTMVRTRSGEVAIEDLDPERHRLIAYAPRDARIYGFKGKGYRFRKAARPYDWILHTIQAGGKATRCTPEHKWLVRWAKGELLDRAHVVYLMQRGGRFRVGWCKLIRSDGIFHLGHRARLECADAAWVLKVTYDRTEASIYESYIGAKYGLPLAPFQPMNGATHYTGESLGRLFEMLKDDLPLRAVQCLLDHRRDPRFPLYSPERAAAKRGGSTSFITEAANLLPCLMAVPIHTCGNRVDWVPINTEVGHYQGLVYSLDVEKYHTYIADGIVTHNCIYSWTGATPDAVLDPEIPEDHKIILKQSYRVPRSVHSLAQRLIQQVGRRQPKDYRPRPADGERHQLNTGSYKTPEYGILKAVLGHLDKGHTVMLLATCAYMLEPLIAVLRKNGIPFHNPFRRANGFWNPIRKGRSGSAANRVLALLAAHPAVGGTARPWTFGDLALWTEWLAAKGILKTGAKTRIASASPDAAVSIATLDELFEPRALELLLDALEGDHRRLLIWWQQRLTASMQARAKFPVMIAHERGPAALEETPGVIVGTIHSVKGGEADAVFLFPDLSQAGDAAYQRAGPARDAVIRLFYVGVTRARQALYLCQRESAMAFHW